MFMKNFDTRRLLSFVRRACQHYGMIDDGDRIAVGLSGGKDSAALLIALCALRKFYPNKFDVVGITVDSGFGGMDFSPVASPLSACRHFSFRPLPCAPSSFCTSR